MAHNKAVDPSVHVWAPEGGSTRTCMDPANTLRYCDALADTSRALGTEGPAREHPQASDQQGVHPAHQKEVRGGALPAAASALEKRTWERGSRFFARTRCRCHTASAPACSASSACVATQAFQSSCARSPTSLADTQSPFYSAKTNLKVEANQQVKPGARAHYLPVTVHRCRVLKDGHQR